MSGCLTKGLLEPGATPVAMLCFAVQSKGLLKSGSTPVVMLCLAVQSKGLLKSGSTPGRLRPGATPDVCYVSLFNERTARARGYPCSHAMFRCLE